MRSENRVGDSLGWRLIFYLLMLSYTARIKTGGVNLKLGLEIICLAPTSVANPSLTKFMIVFSIPIHIGLVM